MEPPTPLADWYTRYLDHHRALGHSAKTIAHYEVSFQTFGRHLAEAGVSPDSRALSAEQLQRFATWLRETPTRPWRGSTQRSIHGVFGILKDMKAFIRWLDEEELLGRRIKVPLPRLPETLFPILSEEELARVWGSRYLTGRSGLATRNRALLALMLDTGLRRGEVVSLTLAQLDLENCLLTVTGKGNKQRRVPYSSSVKALLEAWLRVRGSEAGSLFWLQSDGLRMVFRRIREDVGLAVFHPHQLRHQAATMRIEPQPIFFILRSTSSTVVCRLCRLGLRCNRR